MRAFTSAGLLLAAACSGSECLSGPLCPGAAPVATEITLGAATAELGSLGDTLRIPFVVTDQRGNPMDTEPVWTSSRPGVATVTGGVVTAVANGTSIVTASVGQESAYTSVHVVQRPARIEIESDSVLLGGPGASVTLLISVLDAGGSEVEGQTVTFVSSDATIAAVDSAGRVTGLTPGNALVVASVHDPASPNLEDSVRIVVYPTLQLTTTTISEAVTASPYTQALAAAGGDGRYAWRVVNGGLPAGLSLDASTGVLSGTPVGAGSSVMLVEVSSGDLQVDTATILLQILPALSIDPTAPPAGVRGTAYTAALRATGGSTTRSWQLVAGTLPDGLVLDPATGMVSGTPLASGTFAVTLQVTSEVGGLASRELTFRVYEPVATLSEELPRAIAGTEYRVGVEAIGGAGGYTWSVTSGTLPSGIVLEVDSGVLIGTPEAVGTVDFVLQVTDSVGIAHSCPLTLNVVAPLVVEPVTLPAAEVDASYPPVQLSADGGTPPYTWTLAEGSAPPAAGMSLAPDGTVSGTPLAIGTTTFTARVVSQDGQVAETAVSLEVVRPPRQVVVRCEDRVGSPTPCRVETRNDIVEIGVDGTGVLFAYGVLLTLAATDLEGVFTGALDVADASALPDTLAIPLTGQGGDFCGGEARSLPLVTVHPGGACPGGGIVSSIQEAIFLVQHGGVIELEDGSHLAAGLSVPRDGVTIRAAPGASPIILAGHEVAPAGAALEFLGAGAIEVRDVVVRSRGTAMSAMGIVTGPDDRLGRGAYDQFTVTNVTFEDLSAGVVAMPSSAAGATIAVTLSSFVNATAGGAAPTGVFVLTNDLGSPEVRIEENSFRSLAPEPFRGIGGAYFPRTIGFGSPFRGRIRGNDFRGCTACIDLRDIGVANRTLIEHNTMSEPEPGGIALRARAFAAGDTVSVRDNVVDGVFLGGDDEAQTNYTFATGIEVGGPAGTGWLLERNTVRGAFIAVEHLGATGMSATDFVIDWAFAGLRTASATTADMHLSDVTHVVWAYNWATGGSFADGALSCNWWGSPLGLETDEPAHTPWATAPVANGAGGTCDGTPPPP